MIGKYVIVRCRDAGVHAGTLDSTNGRSCVLSNARRLCLWKVSEGKPAFLNGVANHGLGEGCKIGEAITQIALTENCEIIATSLSSQKSIEGYPSHEGDGTVAGAVFVTVTVTVAVAVTGAVAVAGAGAGAFAVALAGALAGAAVVVVDGDGYGDG